MQPEAFAPHILTAFLRTSRQHFGLAPTPTILRARQPDRLRPMLRSLALIGSLGTALAQPALAAEPSKTNQPPHPSVTQEKSQP